LCEIRLTLNSEIRTIYIYNYKVHLQLQSASYSLPFVFLIIDRQMEVEEKPTQILQNSASLRITGVAAIFQTTYQPQMQPYKTKSKS